MKLKLKVPARDGVPVIEPSIFRLRPTVPSEGLTDQVKGPVPPLGGCILKLYEVPTSPCDREVVVILGRALMVSCML